MSKSRCITGGVDTHKDTHTVAALDENGRLLSVAHFPTTSSGYEKLHAWLGAFGTIARVGIEGTGSYGAGLSRYFRKKSVSVVEVNRPNRQLRRQRGKSDSVDAEAAARAALAGEATGTPKAQNGSVEALRHFRAARNSAVKARTQAANQLHAILMTAPEILRERFRNQTLLSIVKTAAAFRVSLTTGSPLKDAVRHVLQTLARRWQVLNNEIRAFDVLIESHVVEVKPALLERPGIGPDVASTLLVAAGDNPERLKSEASFAALCGVSPVDASSGKQRRHRLNRAGNRDANRALWVVALTRMRCDERTINYAARRRREGLTRKEIIRCLKRYIAREVFALLRPKQSSLDT